MIETCTEIQRHGDLIVIASLVVNALVFLMVGFAFGVITSHDRGPK